MANRNRSLYMRVDKFRKPSIRNSKKKRSMTLPAKVRILLMSRRFHTGLLFMLLVVINFKACMPDINKKCIPYMTGGKGSTRGTITRVETVSYGPKGYNDYLIYYTYTVNNILYSGIAGDRGKGLGYLENHQVNVNYSLKDHSCSCAEDMECLTEKGLFTIITGSILLFISLIYMYLGSRGISAAIEVLEYGDITNATVTGFSTERRLNPLNLNGLKSWHRYVTYLTALFSHTTFDGHKKKCISYIRKRDVLKSGDTLSIIYDPDAPGNALVIEALPPLIKTEPEL